MGTFWISKFDYQWGLAPLSEHTGAHTHLLADTGEGGTPQQEHSLHSDLLYSHFQVQIQGFQSITCPAWRGRSHLCTNDIGWAGKNKVGPSTPVWSQWRCRGMCIGLTVCVHLSMSPCASSVAGRAQGTNIPSKSGCLHLVPRPSHTSQRGTRRPGPTQAAEDRDEPLWGQATHKIPWQVVDSRLKPTCVVSSKGLHRPATSNAGGMAARISAVPVLLDLLWE